jgi:hypothetical protein
MCVWLFLVKHRILDAKTGKKNWHLCTPTARAHKEAGREVQQATLEQLEVGDVDWRGEKGERGSAKES